MKWWWFAIPFLSALLGVALVLLIASIYGLDGFTGAGVLIFGFGGFGVGCLVVFIWALIKEVELNRQGKL